MNTKKLVKYLKEKIKVNENLRDNYYKTENNKLYAYAQAREDEIILEWVKKNEQN